jgi:hypothetical protein
MMPATDDVNETDNRGKRFFEQTIRRLRPGSKFSWHSEASTETCTLSMSGSGVHVKLQITQEALDQAADDPGSHQRLTRDAELQLRFSESGEGVGRVMET